jgi:Arc/MetJ-type ribon-helix-helix transcriptional regulator
MKGLAMETMQITVPEVLRDFLQVQATKAGFPSSSDYIQSLLADLQQRAAEKKELEALLLEGVRSPTVVADAAFWAERRRKVLERDPELKS